MKPQKILSGLIHVSMLFTFLTVFFFSNQAVHKTDNVNAQISQVVATVLKERSLSSKTIDLPQTDDSNVDEYNACLFSWAIGICFLLFSATIAYGWFKRQEINTGEMVYQSSIVLTIIFLFEFAFFHGFAARYQPVLPTDVVVQIQNHLPG